MSRFSLRSVLLASLLTVLLVGNLSPLIPRARAAASSCGSWRIVPSPPAPTFGLYGVSIISHTDVWAVAGGPLSLPTIYPINVGFVEHWDGTSWSTIRSPQPANYENDLYAVATLSPSNVWAVGSYENSQNGYLEPQDTLVEHWDGTQWSVIASPSSQAFFNTLSGVAALAPDDIWAVGSQESLSGTSQTLIEHWNGTLWSIVPSPNVGSYDNELEGVDALSPDDIWAIGDSSDGKGGNRTLVEQWNGQQWSVVPSPSIGTFPNYLREVAGVAPDDLWTVGTYWSYPGDITNTLTEHWNGTQWSVATSPNPPGGDNDLSGVAALATNNVWATGYTAGVSLILHWDGQQWSRVSSPGGGGGLHSIEALNAHDIWAVGQSIMHYC
jgi:hypothetical protein